MHTGSLDHYSIGCLCSDLFIAKSCQHFRKLQVTSNMPKHIGVEHVILIGVDRLGSIYFEKQYASYPTFNRLIQNGTSTFRARTSIPTISAPNWCSILSGMSVVQCSVFDNEWSINSAELEPITGIVHTIFDIAKQHKSNITAITGKKLQRWQMQTISILCFMEMMTK